MSPWKIDSTIYILLSLLWLAAVATAIYFWFQRAKRIYIKTWYDLSCKGPNEEMEWHDIRKLIARDPLDNVLPTCKFRKCSAKYWCLDILILVLSLAVISLTGILSIKCCFDPSCALSSESSIRDMSWAILFAIPTVAISIIGLFYQIRLRARSANRQEWINSIRKDIGLLLQSLPPPNSSVRNVEWTASKVLTHYTRLELYLNPSERVHRAFLAIILLMYGASSSSSDEEVRKELRLPNARFDHNNLDEMCNARDWCELRMKAVRLANVLLKREWEQVKFVK